MMKHIFLTQPNVISPRWQEAFADALIIEHLEYLPANLNLPANLSSTLLWLLVNDEVSAHLPEWIANGARVVVLSKMEDLNQAKQAVGQGAHGYLHYLAAVSVLQQVAEVVALGGLWLGADLMRQLVFATAKITSFASVTGMLDTLTLREKSVAEAVAVGKSNKEVARDLDISERTVKAHLSAVFEKLGVRDRLHLVLVMAKR